jgi:hypothetical protein
MAAMCFAAAGASKITPHELHAFGELRVALLQVVDVFSHASIVHTKFENGKSNEEPGAGADLEFDDSSAFIAVYTGS